MAVLDELLASSKPERGSGAPGATRGLCLITCSDPQLTVYLDRVLDLDAGEAVVIRLPGAALPPGGGDLFRAVAAALYVNECTEIIVLGHTECGLSKKTAGDLMSAVARRSGSRNAINGDARDFFGLTSNPRQAVQDTAAALRALPFLPTDVKVHAALFETATGRITVVERGENAPSAATGLLPSLASSGFSMPELPSGIGGLGGASMLSSGASGLSGASSLGGLSGSSSIGGLSGSSSMGGLSGSSSIGGASGPMAMNFASLQSAPLNLTSFQPSLTPMSSSAIDLTPSMSFGTPTALPPPMELGSLQSMSQQISAAPAATPEERQPAPPPPRMSPPPRKAKPAQASPGPLLTKELAGHIEKVRAFYASEIGDEARTEVRARLQASFNQGAETPELIKIVIKPILESGQKRYKVIDELLAIKDALSKMERVNCQAALNRLLE